VQLRNEVNRASDIVIDSQTSILLSPNIDSGNTELRINIASLLQSWVNGFVENHGILLRTNQPGSDVSRLAIHSGKTDPTKAPRLELDLTVAPTIE
jgi:hypothetical protein